ncbi:MAG: response regulator transcription factor [Ornithinimicrobium sp.]
MTSTSVNTRSELPMVALVNDYEVVVRGLADMLAPYDKRVLVAEIDAQAPPSQAVDLTLYDSFAAPQTNDVEIDRFLSNPLCGRVVVYSWSTQRDLVLAAVEKGVAGYLSKALSGEELAAALQRVHAGELVLPLEYADEQGGSEVEGSAQDVTGWWPGQEFGLSAREAEVLSLITQGLSNSDIARRSYLSPNTVKSYIRSAYRKIDVDTRSRAVIWGMNNGFAPDRVRVVHNHRDY